MFKTNLIIFIAILSVCSGDARSHTNTSNSIHISDFKNGELTLAGRNPSENQLKCIGGNSFNFEISVIQCKNTGFDGTTVHWKCEAELPTHYRLGKTDVVCEGYSKTGDEYLLKGSCMVEYTLHSNKPNVDSNYSEKNTDRPNIIDFFMFLVAVGCFGFVILVCIWER
jgi:hypothetical protein